MRPDHQTTPGSSIVPPGACSEEHPENVSPTTGLEGMEAWIEESYAADVAEYERVERLSPREQTEYFLAMGLEKIAHYLTIPLDKRSPLSPVESLRFQWVAETITTLAKRHRNRPIA